MDTFVNENDDREDGVVLDIIDDTPEQDRGKPVAALDSSDADEGHEDEVAGYSKRVKERIDHLTKRAHMERRAKEEAARQLNEIVNYTKSMAEENNRLKKLVTDGESVLITQARERLLSDMEMAKANLKKAYEEGDSERIADWQARLARAAADQANVEQWKPQPFQPTYVPEIQGIPNTNMPDPEALSWHEKNPWYGVDQELTGTAWRLHQRLILKGVQPNSDEYYRKIDEGMRKHHPDFFEDDAPRGEQRQSFSPVAAVNRAPAGKPRRVKLTASQVALAHRLGITPEQYASQLIKEI